MNKKDIKLLIEAYEKTSQPRFETPKQILQQMKKIDPDWRQVFSEILGDYTRFENNLRPDTVDEGISSLEDFLSYLLGEEWRNNVNLRNLYLALEKEQERYWRSPEAQDEIRLSDDPSAGEIYKQRELYLIFKTVFGEHHDNSKPTDIVNKPWHDFMMRKIKSKVEGTYNDEVYEGD